MTHPRYVCIHGHFYQPPRENPWLEAIEAQDSAHPFHDWNERITAECYAPNSAARIQDDKGHILGIINNYARMSYNFGPTLLSWMEVHAPDVYQSILDADQESAERFGGHGSAVAQVYNHIIMPLANKRDQHTQVVWGIRDFEKRFKRKPEGMWLAEAAVNLDTLECLAEEGIKFTILAPRQAKRVRPLAAPVPSSVPEFVPPTVAAPEWIDVSEGRVDPARVYRCALPSGKSIALYFYDGPISQAVAFEGLLRSGETFADRLLSGLSDKRDFPQLLHIATDGETYGHHHTFGEMALAYALHYIEVNKLAELINYGQFLELHPPDWEAEIFEDSSWSCSHGVERWRSDCGCNSGGKPGWMQAWRTPLRQSLDWLTDTTAPLFETTGSRLFNNPWAARDAYVDVILSRDDAATDRFLKEQGAQELTADEAIRALKLMEMQRQLMLMYTSCGWFFDELSGIETVQIIQYASRAVQLAEEVFGIPLEEDFKKQLEKAKSNIPEHVDGRWIYDNLVKGAMVGLTQVGAHYAVSSLFSQVEAKTRIYAYHIYREDLKHFEAGHAKLVIGKGRIVSDVTREEAVVTFAALHFGDHNLTAGVRGPISDASYDAFVKEASTAFLRMELPTVIRVLDRQFFGLTFSLGSLFKDERQKILDQILKTMLEQATSTLRIVFEDYAPLMTFLTGIGMRQPEVLRSVGRFVMGADLRQLVEEGVPQPHRARALMADARLWQLPLDAEGLGLSLNKALVKRAEELHREPHRVEPMEALLVLVEVAKQLPFQVNFWRAQNVYYELLQRAYPAETKKAVAGDPDAKAWVDTFRRLGEGLMVKVE